TQVPQASMTLAAGGVRSDGVAQTTVVLFSSSGATVTTDKTDYAPGETVTITGTGWEPGETVDMVLHREPETQPDTTLSSVADPSGNFTNDTFVVNQLDLGVTFMLTATGATSGYTAQTTFTDTNPDNTSMTVSCSPNPVSVNNASTCTATVNNTQTSAPSGWPQGTVAFGLTGSGTLAGGFSGSPCTLTQVGLTNNSKCSVTFTPSVGGINYVKGQYNASPTPTKNWNNNNAVTSFTANATVDTTLSLAAPSPASVPYGSTRPVTFTATLTRTSGGAAVSGATITFMLDAPSVGTAETNGSGLATLSTYNPSALSVASHNVQASFAGATISGTTYNASSSGTATLTVNKATPTVSVNNIPSNAVYGGNFTPT